VGFLFAERRQIYFSKIQHAAQLTTDFGMSSFARIALVVSSEHHRTARRCDLSSGDNEG